MNQDLVYILVFRRAVELVRARAVYYRLQPSAECPNSAGVPVVYTFTS